uniref:Uncharacterized protein n=1 Tax=Mimivirus LCMiAC02 TaxID=2506609 RepID=A0A4D5XF50_9VIRU|nr:MAG: hypothetical protein LCMiAC02_04550 [Mimivirus LCMiAC02]
MSAEYYDEYENYDTDIDIELTLKNAKTTDDKIIIIENILSELRDDASNVWHNIISPYINDSGQILNNLYKCGASEYIKFICENNEGYKKLIGELHYLYRKQAKEYESQKKNRKKEKKEK